MKSFWSGLFNAGLNGSLQIGSAAAQNGATSAKDLGTASGLGFITGLLGFILSHPATHPSVSTAIKITPIIVPGAPIVDSPASPFPKP
jgi:hypothetical protein